MHERYLIYSVEHDAWWGSGGSGYVLSLALAGTYSRAEALDICTRAIPGTASRLGALPELPVRVEDARMMHDRFRGQYPSAPPEPWE
jgi:hypothetical protein